MTAASGRDGRARRRDPRGTRASILKAAERIFVSRGYAGASMSDIAKAARVTKSLIHHHFGSKEDLCTEVKRKRLQHYAEVQSELMTRDETGVEVLRHSIETYFHFLRENPQYVRLSTWMMLEDPRLSQASYPELLEGGVERIRREQEAGRLRDDVEPMHMLAQFIALSMYWFMGRESTLSTLVDGEDADSRYLTNLLKIYFEGVLPR